MKSESSLLFVIIAQFFHYFRHEGRSWYSAHRGRLWIASTAQTPTDLEIQSLEEEYRDRLGG